MYRDGNRNLSINERFRNRKMLHTTGIVSHYLSCEILIDNEIFM